MLLEISQNSQENTCVRVSFFNKVAGDACNFIKKRVLVQVLSCEFCEISKNSFSYRTPLVDASVFDWIFFYTKLVITGVEVTAKKVKISLRISSVSVKKIYRIYWRNPWWKASVFICITLKMKTFNILMVTARR